MVSILKARKIYTCAVCGGNIQKGEKYIHVKHRLPVYDSDDKQTGIEFYSYRTHNKSCFPRLLNFSNQKQILKNCNFGIHKPTWDRDPDSYNDSTWCEWCGRNL